MTIYQQYYTSFVGQTGQRHKGGFGVKAASLGMPGAAKMLLRATVGYRMPPSLPSDAVEQHPIALRYFSKDSLAVLSCVQSSGKDELGRDGNFFAHSLVGNPHDLACLAPIFYWKSGFWVKHDNSNDEILPALSDLDGVPIGLDYGKISTFLEAGNRQDWYYRLMSAVVDYGQSKRPIIIIDTDENTAYWIAAVSIAVPAKYTQQLTFATYYHEPLNSPFLLTGTTVDSGIRQTKDESIRYFILNATDGLVGEAPDSDFARFVANHVERRSFESVVAGFIEWEAAYGFSDRELGPFLNDLVNFYNETQRETHSGTEKAIKSAQTFLERVSGLATSSPTLTADTRHALALTRIGVANGAAPVSTYLRGVRGIKWVNDELVNQANETTSLLADLVLQKRGQDAKQLFTGCPSELRKEMEAVVNSSSILNRLAEGMHQHDVQQCVGVWHMLGGIFKLAVSDPELKPILHSSFSVIDVDIGEHSQPKQLIEALLQYAGDQGLPALLDIASQYAKSNPKSQVLEQLYYAKVQPLPLQQRESIWKQYWRIYRTLYRYELERELKGCAGTEELVKWIPAWCTAFAPQDRLRVLGDILKNVWDRTDISQQGLAIELLGDINLFQYLPPDWIGTLLEKVVATASIELPDDRTAALYRRILSAREITITPEAQEVLEGALVLHSRQITPDQAERLQKRFIRLDANRYREEAPRVMAAVFATNPDMHLDLVGALYVEKHREAFWELYWLQFQKDLLAGRVSAMISILNTWFQHIVPLEENNLFITAEFFTELPNALTAARESKGFQKIEEELEKNIARQPWAYIVRRYLAKERRGILRLFGN